jgi:hypothetical protein
MPHVHEQTIIEVPHCLFLPTVDDPRPPQRDGGETREISQDWLASAESPTQDDQNRCVTSGLCNGPSASPIEKDLVLSPISSSLDFSFEVS